MEYIHFAKDEPSLFCFLFMCANAFKEIKRYSQNIELYEKSGFVRFKKAKTENKGFVYLEKIENRTVNITVYLGAFEGNDPALADEVKKLGTWIGESGHSLIYGGSKSGLMGVIAESVLEAGGDVTGVEPQFFVDAELQYDEITKLIVTENMEERKTKMIELGDAFIAFPGGTGTLEEISEVMSKVSLKQLDAPCILYNLNGYYNGLKELLEHMIKMGLSSEERQEGIYFVENLEQIKEILGRK